MEYCLSADYLIAELSIKERLSRRMPELKAVLTDDQLTREPDACLKITPAAILTYEGDEDMPGQSQENSPSVALYQRWRIHLVVKAGMTDCNGFKARRAIGPLLSKLLGINAAKTSALDDTGKLVYGTEDCPAVGGVLPGFTPTHQFGPMFRVRAPRPWIYGSFYFFPIDFLTRVVIRGAPDFTE